MTGHRRQRTGLFAAGLLTCLIVFEAVLQACQVPVFRYALERWEPDPYEVLVLSNGPLTPDQQKAWEQLRASSVRPSSGFLTRHVDISAPSSRQQFNLPEKSLRPQPGKAIVVVMYPEKAQVAQRVAHSCELTLQNIRAVTQSPSRKKIADHLTAGDSATWVFLPCGNRKKDAQALETLTQHLQKEAERIQLPSAEELEVSEDVLDAARIKLRIGFSVVQVDRHDPAERFLVDALLNSEDDLRNYDDEPIAFPVFGRGRVLYALIGKGINAETITAANVFMTGPCSCQVKYQNPGFDLLSGFDWKTAVGDNLISEPIPDPPTEPQLLTIPPGKKKK